MANEKPVGVAYSDPELVAGTTITGATITNPTITGATLTGGAFNGTVGATTPSTGSFTTVAVSTSQTYGVGSSFIADSGTATSTAAAATISKMAGVITTESLTTAANGDYTFTLTNTLITANSNLFVQVGYGTSTTGHPNLRKVTPGAGSATIVIHNDDVAVALNGTLIIQFFLVKP